MGQLCPLTDRLLSMTKRNSFSPLDDATSRRSTIGAEHGITRSSRPGIGWTVNRTLGRVEEPKVSISKACSAEVRAPVSTLARSAGTPRSGSAIHSSHPNCSVSGASGVSVMGCPFLSWRWIRRIRGILNAWTPDDSIIRLRTQGNRRVGARRRHIHPARASAHAGLHAGGYGGHGQGDDAGIGPRYGRGYPAGQHLSPDA